MPKLFELDGGRVAVANATRLFVVSRDDTTRVYFPALGLPPLHRKIGSDFGTSNEFSPAGCALGDVTSGAANSIWGVCDNTIVEIAADGTVRRHQVPFEQSAPASLFRGPDGSIWFVETTQSKIGCISPDGKLHEIPI
jgi:streptogramin lyase